MAVAVAALEVGGTASAPDITFVKNSGRVAATVAPVVLAVPVPVLVMPLVAPDVPEDPDVPELPALP